MAQPFGGTEYTEPLSKAFDAVREGVDRAVEAFNCLVDRVKEWAWMLGAATVYWIKTNLDKARAALRTLVDTARDAAAHQVRVDYAVELAGIVTAFAGHCVDALVEAGGVVTLPRAVDALGDAAGMLEKGLDNLPSVGQRVSQPSGG